MTVARFIRDVIGSAAAEIHVGEIEYTCLIAPAVAETRHDKYNMYALPYGFTCCKQMNRDYVRTYTYEAERELLRKEINKPLLLVNPLWTHGAISLKGEDYRDITLSLGALKDQLNRTEWHGSANSSLSSLYQNVL